MLVRGLAPKGAIRPYFFNPTDGTNKVANMNWAGWIYAQSMLNDKGVYTDMHDRTSMGAKRT